MSDQPKRPVETPREWLRYSDDDMTVAEPETLPLKASARPKPKKPNKRQGRFKRG